MFPPLIRFMRNTCIQSLRITARMSYPMFYTILDEKMQNYIIPHTILFIILYYTIPHIILYYSSCYTVLFLIIYYTIPHTLIYYSSYYNILFLILYYTIFQKLLMGLLYGGTVTLFSTHLSSTPVFT